MLDEYRTRRDSLHDWLTADPRIRCVKPAGAFYLFPDVSDVLSADGFATSTDFAQALLDESRVAVTPGEAFDAPGFVRLSYATSMENLREGSRRLLEFVAARAAVRRVGDVGCRKSSPSSAPRTIGRSSATAPCAPSCSRATRSSRSTRTRPRSKG